MSFTWELMRTKTCSVIPNSMWAILKMPAMNTSNWLAFRNLGRKVMVMEVENLHWMSKVLASRWEGWLPAVVCGNIFEHSWVVGESQDDLGSKLWYLGCEINDRYRNGKQMQEVTKPICLHLPAALPPQICQGSDSWWCAPSTACCMSSCPLGGCHSKLTFILGALLSHIYCNIELYCNIKFGCY